jgi:hypothetical protein
MQLDGLLVRGHGWLVVFCESAKKKRRGEVGRAGGGNHSRPSLVSLSPRPGVRELSSALSKADQAPSRAVWQCGGERRKIEVGNGVLREKAVVLSLSSFLLWSGWRDPTSSFM